jgi:hypothetical protein
MSVPYIETETGIKKTINCFYHHVNLPTFQPQIQMGRKNECSYFQAPTNLACVFHFPKSKGLRLRCFALKVANSPLIQLSSTAWKHTPYFLNWQRIKHQTLLKTKHIMLHTKRSRCIGQTSIQHKTINVAFIIWIPHERNSLTCEYG